MKESDLTIIYYTANLLETANPYFLANTKRQLVKAVGNCPLIVVSHKPTPSFEGYNGEYVNLVAGRDYSLHNEGRSHLNIYWQILIGCRVAKTEYVAMAEDDILYSREHFHSLAIDRGFRNDRQVFLYDMNKLSLFTWTKPPVFSFRHNRMVVNQLIAPRKMLVEAMEERFARLEELKKTGKKEEEILKYWGDPGRYEKYLGVTKRSTDTFMCTCPSVVLSHEFAFGYLLAGELKRLGDLRIIEVPFWGRAEDVLKLFYGH